MEALELEKLLSLSSLAALGFVFRYFYRLELQKEKEEAVELLLWSLVWSAVLGITFKAFGWPINDQITKFFAHTDAKPPLKPDEVAKVVAATSRALAGTFNLGWACFLGFAIGRIQRGWILSEREVGRKAGVHDAKLRAERVKLALRGLVGKPLTHYKWLLLEYLDNHCNDNWVVVSFSDGTAIMGYFQLGEKVEEGASHVLLKYPRPFDVQSQVSGKPTSTFVLLNLEDVRAISVSPVSKPNVPKEKPKKLSAKPHSHEEHSERIETPKDQTP